MMNKIISILVLILTLQSCASKKDLYYFQDADRNYSKINYESTKIQPNDILSITVGALVPETAIPYNIQNNSEGNSSIEILKLQGYLVSVDGTIDFPVLGNLAVTKVSTSELENELQRLLESGGHLLEPRVVVRLLNAKVTVLGEVNNPGTYSFTEQNITLPQALGFAGDLTINGKRKNILLFREEGGERKTMHIDLTSTDWFTTPYFYIKPNDLIVVNPNSAKVKSSGVIGNAGIVLTIVSLLLTSVVLITR